MRLLKALMLAVAGVLSAGTARADVTPHPIFTDNMVLQQGGDVVVWGIAAPGESVDVKLAYKMPGAGGESSTSTTADKDGKWSVKFSKLKAGTGYTMTVKGKNTIEFKNVAV